MSLVPIVIQPSFYGERSYDIYSALLDDRIIFLNEHINDVNASLIVAQLLYLENKDKYKDIYLYLNSPGGSVTSGFSIYDTINYINCDVNTICIGSCASMGAFLLSSGTKGKRFSLPNSEIMIHQPKGGLYGQTSDVEIHAYRLIKMKQRLNKILAYNCDKPIEIIELDTDRDNFMLPFEAVEYGLIDKVISKNAEV